MHTHYTVKNIYKWKYGDFQYTIYWLLSLSAMWRCQICWSHGTIVVEWKCSRV